MEVSRDISDDDNYEARFHYVAFEKDDSSSCSVTITNDGFELADSYFIRAVKLFESFIVAKRFLRKLKI